MKKIVYTQLVLGFHTTINPSIIFGLQFNENSLKNVPIKTAAQIFLKSPMKVSTTKIDDNQIQNTKNYIKENNIFLVVHGQYIINFIRDGSTIQWARKSLIDDIRTFNKIIHEKDQNKTGVVIHLGKVPNKESNEECIKNFTENIRNVIDNTMDCNVKIILETSTKTKGCTDIFHNIETFGELIKSIKLNLGETLFKKRIGTCIDSCHVFASGYNIRTKKAFEEFISLWDTHIGIENITIFHLNDSKGDVCCSKDRHEQIGNGFIYKNEKSGLHSLLNFAKSNTIPIIIESGGNQDEEIKLITNLMF